MIRPRFLLRKVRGLNSRRDGLIVGWVALAGVGLSLWLWRSVRAVEEAREEMALSQQVEARHALIRETLAGYEECLLAMRVFMTHGRDIDQARFATVARTQLARHPGFLGIQWAPRVRAEERAGWERAHGASLGTVGGIRERVQGGSDVIALPRADYFPILFVEPYDTNRHVVGSDAAASPLRPVFDAAAASRAPMMSGLLKLVYESGPNDGVVMVCPVYLDGPGSTNPTGVDGYLLGVFRVADLLGQPWNRAPGSTLDVMFVDELAARPDRRVLYCHHDQAAGGGIPTEADFRRRPHRAASLAVAGRTWMILYRSVKGWPTPVAGSAFMALAAGLAVTFLGSGLLALHFRHTRTIEREVRQRTEELGESRRQLGAVMQALPGMAFRGTYEDNLNLTFISEGALDLTGYEPADFLEGRIHLRDIVHPEDLGRVRARTRLALGERRDIEVEYRIRTRSGSEKWVLSRGRGSYEIGAPPVFEGLAIDITAQKNAETARLALERKLLAGQKLESLGLLAGGIAHDFNNLLSTVLGNAEMVRLALPPGSETETKLRAIEAAAVRAAELCRQMLEYAGKGKLVVEPTDISALVEGLMPQLKVSIARLAGLRLNLARGIPAVAADATQLRQIVMHLVLNAADAIADRGGEIVLETGVTQATAAALARCVVGADLRPGDYVFLEVRDDGAGMTPEVLARIFDPFYSTKDTGRGLGLAEVLGLVRGHGGALSVVSAPGAGSAFRLLLPPVAGALPAAKDAGHGVASRWQQSGDVLVVDGEREVGLVIAEMLRSFGFTPTEAADGQEAIAAMQANPARFELAVLDLLVPGLSGEQTLERLRGLRPGLRVLLTSGLGEEDVVRRLGEAGPLRFLAKPFTRAALERELRALLG